MYFCGSNFRSTLNSIDMSKLRVLYVASEINPFLQTSEVADFVRKLPQAMQEKGMEIRILVPRFGIINERKNRLHEVVRLSGINVSVDGEQGVGPELARKYGIEGYPSLIVTDASGNIVLQTEGYVDPAYLISFAKEAIKRKS